MYIIHNIHIVSETNNIIKLMQVDSSTTGDITVKLKLIVLVKNNSSNVRF